MFDLLMIKGRFKRTYGARLLQDLTSKRPEKIVPDDLSEELKNAECRARWLLLKQVDSVIVEWQSGEGIETRFRT